MSTRHECGKYTNGNDWMICSACGGRVHLEGCTSRRNPSKDCCKARHQRLHDSGQTVGLYDSSVPMLGSHATS